MDPCCCDRSCTIEEDDFNRPNNTDLGSKWNEVVAGAEILDQELVMAAGAKVVCTTRHPVNTPTCYAFVDLVDLSDGATYKVSVNADVNGDGGEEVTVVSEQVLSSLP